MDEPQKSRTCDLCHKEVAEVNFDLHEVHCRRFLCQCPECDESVPTEQLTQHKEEQHTLVKCEKCKKNMQRCRLNDHEADECVERMQECEFCQIDLPWKDLHQHQVACGSRTDLCVDCGQYVKLVDQRVHDQTCSSRCSSATNTDTLVVNCGYCSLSFPAEDLDHHELECLMASGLEIKSQDYFSGSAANKTTDVHHGDDPDQLNVCPHCDLLLPTFTLQWHEVKCRRLHV